MSRSADGTLYALLGVPVDASNEAIRRAFRARARTAHPDAGGDPDAFRRLQDAYETLRDPGRRRDYDERLGLGRAAGPVAAATTGWSGPQGDFSGDVEFPAYLRDVVESPWTAAERPGAPVDPAGAASVAADVVWWWPEGATHRPVVAGATVVLSGRRTLVAAHVATGHEVWSVDVGSAVVTRPMVEGDLVLVGAGARRLEAYDLGGGVLRWAADVGAPLTTPLALAPDRSVVLGAGLGVAAHDPATGARRWATRLPAAPTSVTPVGAHVVVTTAADTVHGLELRRGRQRWWVKGAPVHDVAPVAAGPALWLVTGAGRVAHLVPGSGAVAASVLVGAAVSGLVGAGRHVLVSAAGPARVLALDGEGQQRWALELSEACPEPAVDLDADRLVVALPSGRLRVASARAGWPMGSIDLPFEPVGAPVLAPDRILATDRRGTVWAVTVLADP